MEKRASVEKMPNPLQLKRETIMSQKHGTRKVFLHSRGDTRIAAEYQLEVPPDMLPEQ